MKNKVTVIWPDGCRKRVNASSYSAGGETLPKGTITFTDKSTTADLDEPTNPDKKWIQLSDGWFIATRFPASEGVERATVETVIETDPPPQNEDTVTVTVETSDGKHGSATIVLK
jgi:hypothetical protein